MKVSAIKTERLVAGSLSLAGLLDKFLTDFPDNSVLAVTSKIVSICEGRIVPFGKVNKEELIISESDSYLPPEVSKYGYHFTVTASTIVSMAGIDESNGGGNYVLWPKDAQKSANEIRKYLKKRFKLKNVGVIITDSVSQPLRRGTIGIALAHSGFSALNNYMGKKDLFGRNFSFVMSNVSGGLAAAAVLMMGEGSEQTPLAIISDLPLVNFQNRNPNAAELALTHIKLDEDLFAPFLTSAPWMAGGGS